MIIEKLDKIMLTYKEYHEISTWVQEQKFDSVDITLNEGMVIMSDIEHLGFQMEIGIYFRIDNSTGNMFIQQYDAKTMTPIVSATIDERFFSDGYIDISIEDRLGKLINKDRLDKSIKISILTVLDIFQYMNHYQENVVVTKESKSVRTKPRPNSKSKRSNIIPLKSKKYTFTNTNNPFTKRKYNQTKEVWSVKGHWRHYSNGIKVWIKPHKRGVGEVEEGKIYRAN